MDQINSLINNIDNEIVKPLVALLAVIATLIFLWGVFDFVKGANDEKKREIGIKHMLWGIVGLAIMFGANGLVALIKEIIGA